jgi:hypothetical protein
MIRVMLDLDLFEDLLYHQEKLDRIGLNNDEIEIYVINDFTEKRIDASRKYRHIPSVKPFLYSSDDSDDKEQVFLYHKYLCGGIFVNVIPIDENIIREAGQILSDIKDIESAVELLCARNFDLDLVITDHPDLFKYKILDKNTSISYLVTVEDTDYLSEIILHKDDKFIELDEVQIKKVVEFVENHGKEDWNDWHENYDKLDSKLEIIEEVLSIFCQRDDYHSLKSLWKNLNRFCDLYGYYELRVKWLTKLIVLAEKEQDWNYYFSANVSTAWTRIMQGELEEADKLLTKARTYLHLVTDKQHLLSFYYCIFTYYVHFSSLLENKSPIRQENLSMAKIAINKQQEILNEIKSYSENAQSTSFNPYQDKAVLDCQRIQRYQINIIRNNAKLNYLTDHLDTALEQYNEVIRQSEEINHLRSKCYALNKIADIYLSFAEQSSTTKDENLLKAQHHLQEGMPIAIRNRNSRRIASYYTSESRLLRIQGDKDKSIDMDKIAHGHRIGFQLKQAEMEQAKRMNR